MELSGSLSGLGVRGLLHLLERSRQTGRVSLRQGRWTGELEVVSGRPVRAVLGQEAGSEALALMARAFSHASFTFEARPPRDDDGSAVPLQVDEAALDQPAGSTPLLDRVPRMREPHAETGAVKVDRRVIALLREVDGRRTVDAIAARSGLGPTLRGLDTLAELGLIEFAPTPPRPPAPRLDASRPPAPRPGMTRPAPQHPSPVLTGPRPTPVARRVLIPRPPLSPSARPLVPPPPRPATPSPPPSTAAPLPVTAAPTVPPPDGVHPHAPAGETLAPQVPPPAAAEQSRAANSDGQVAAPAGLPNAAGPLPTRANSKATPTTQSVQPVPTEQKPASPTPPRLRPPIASGPVSPPPVAVGRGRWRAVLRPSPIVLGVAGVGLAGLLVATAVSSVSGPGRSASSAEPLIEVTAATPVAIDAAPAAVERSAPTAPAAPTAAAPPATPTAQVAPQPPATVTVDDAWASLLTSIAGPWNHDWPTVIDRLAAFRRSYPDYGPAQDKLYVALLASGQSRIAAGDLDAGRQQLELAQALLPARPEAPAALATVSASNAPDGPAVAADEPASASSAPPSASADAPTSGAPRSNEAVAQDASAPQAIARCGSNRERRGRW